MRKQEVIALIQAQNESGLAKLFKHYGPLTRYTITPVLPESARPERILT